MDQGSTEAAARDQHVHERYRYVKKILPEITYAKVAGPVWRHAGETTYQVLHDGKVIGFVGLRRRESWRKHGRIRVGLIGLTRDWWSGEDADGSRVYSDYAYSRAKATEDLLRRLYDLAHPEQEVIGKS